MIDKYKNYKNHNDKDQQNIKFFDKLYREFLQDNVIDRKEYESLCYIFTKYLEETKDESFL